jgi:hypothetical protein
VYGDSQVESMPCGQALCQENVSSAVRVETIDKGDQPGPDVPAEHIQLALWRT